MTLKPLFLALFLTGCGAGGPLEDSTYLAITPALVDEYPSVVDVFQDAVQDWRSAGFPYTIDVQRASRAWDSGNRALLDSGEITNSDAVGITRLRPDYRLIVIRAGLGPDQLHQVVLHELGHFIGLDHTPSRRDVMFWRPAATELSKGDRAAVRELYRP